MSRSPNCCRKRQRDITKAHPQGVIRQTWRTLGKAAGDPDPQFEWLQQIADAAAPEVRQRFIEAIKNIRGTVQEAKLRAALERGNLEDVMAILGLDRDLSQIEPALMASLTTVVHDTAVAALEATPPIALKGGELAMRFDAINPHTVQAVRNYGFNLIRQITDDTRDGIRAIVADAMEFGGHPYEQARQIRSLIGLTSTQASAVTNYRRLLTTRDSAALDRELRDRRFDNTVDASIRGNVDLSPEQIDRMVERYGDRMLAARAENIARTETINAARLGTQAAWTQATENGLLNRNDVRQGWMVTPDDRLCVYCEAVPDMNPEGVPLGGQFETPLGPVDGPTLHPQCRCVLYLISF